ncbi:flagellar assembly protein FliH, partial [Massilia solisilvae]
AEGLAQGRAAGHAEGLAQGRAEATAELQRLRTIADTFGQAVARADETIASDVLDLALHLARGMVKTAFDVRPDLIIPVVREAIEYLPVLQQPALLVLNPLDAPVVRAGIGEELEKGGWRVVEDAQVGRGGCKIDTASNQIDAQAATRWQRLAHALGKNVDWLEP